MKTERPRIEIEKTQFDQGLEIAAVITLIVLCVSGVHSFWILPDRVPVYFKPSGMPGGYGGKWLYLIFPVVGAALYGLMTFLNNYPHRFNFPFKITEENAERQYINAILMMRVLKLSVLLMFLLVAIYSHSVATGEAEGLPAWMFPLTLGFILGPLIFFFIRMFQLK